MILLFVKSPNVKLARICCIQFVRYFILLNFKTCLSILNRLLFFFLDNFFSSLSLEDDDGLVNDSVHDYLELMKVSSGECIFLHIQTFLREHF